MNRNTFHLLLKRYLDGSCSDEEHRIIDQWYELLDDEAIFPVTEENAIEIEKRLWIKINHHVIESVSTENEEDEPIKKWWLRWLSAAAVVAVLIAGGWLFVSKSSPPDSIVSNKIKEGFLEKENNTSLSELVSLEDGSTVMLQPHTRIAFPVHFQKEKREVYFEGEGFFTVKRNISRPFFVYNNKLVTEVLGTSFNIKIIDNQIEVSVKTGRVAVYENGQRINLDAQKKEGNGVIITPNQKVTYYEKNRHFITSLVDVPAPVNQTDSSRVSQKTEFVFDDTPLSEVLKAIEKTYGIEIVLEKENLNGCPFTGDISRQNLYNKLEFICQAMQASYEIKGTKILIKGGHICN